MFERERYHRPTYERRTVCNFTFVVFVEPAVITEPCECALNNPTLLHRDEFLRDPSWVVRRVHVGADLGFHPIRQRQLR